MKKTILLLILTLLIFSAYSFYSKDYSKNAALEEGIVFHNGTWQEALDLAKKEDKLIFLDVYATWCGPCRMLKKNTFSDAEVGSIFNSQFVNVAIDAEKGEGIEISKKYKVRSFPTLLFIDKKGNIFEKTVGYQKPNELIAFGQKHFKN